MYAGNIKHIRGPRVENPAPSRRTYVYVDLYLIKVKLTALLQA